ncbi:serine/threonine protein kinase [Nannocystis exedens]|uniref:Serine/threonine protein kinase n=1 Tax=Nannocystis exedens TaxID=54 RepID=A0A1I2AR84_9BACT|nr:serine/threonine-protein kinase [Nannocystis exedens]PCC74229.1 Serine/threonine-protein kinase Pkn1 [Nannocystis exedens]SFE46535.1 serine/threonine protein kinase [Nannocystis exedens]
MNAESAGAHLEACPFCGADHDEATLRCPATDMVLPFEGRMLAGKFRLVSELGRGGMGAVWRARNVHVDRDVALKLILPEALKNKEIVARFQNEARVAARIGHPGICDILDLETSALGPVIVMELLRGENLGQRIAREGKLAPAAAVALIREALHALDAAHRAGIIHRDLKPENLFIHQPDTGPAVIKLMDFGISKFIDRDGALTGSGVLMGTPEYMAPEQINGAVFADARTDIWAIGAVLYKAITGVDPFTAASVPATLIAIITAEPEPVDARVPGVPRALSAVILRCLAKKPDDRFQSAKELADALQPFEAPAAAVSPPVVTTHAAVFAPTVALPLPPPPTSPPRWPARLMGLLVLGAAAVAVWWYAGRPDAPPIELPTIVSEALRTVDPAPAAAPGPTAGAGAVPTPPPQPVVVPPPVPENRVEEPAATTGEEPAPASTTATPTPETPPPAPSEPPPPAPSQPPPLITAGDLVTPAALGKTGNQHWAKEYCAALDKNKYLGIARWKLANPAEAKSFAKVAGIKPGGYWTTAAHRGRALVVWLPKGNQTSVRLTTKAARPLCVAPKP